MFTSSTGPRGSHVRSFAEIDAAGSPVATLERAASTATSAPAQAQAQAPSPSPSRTLAALLARVVAGGSSRVAASVPATITAEMPSRASVGTTIVVRLRIMRSRPGASIASIAASRRVSGARSPELRVSIVPRGFRVAGGGDRPLLVRLPSGDVDEYAVELVGAAPGRGEVSVIVRGPVELPLATLRLRSQVVAAGDDLDAPAVLATAVITEPAGEIASLPTIRIDEAIIGDDSTLHLAVAVGGACRECTTRLDDKRAFIAETHRRIRGLRSELAEFFTDPALRGAEGTRKLRALGMGLFHTLFHPDVQRFVWEHRDELDDLIVQSSGELDIPWEIVHLAPPPGVPDDGELRFLSGFGVTRWVYDTAHPATLNISRPRVRCVCPEYRDERLHLTFTRDEGELLTELLDAAPVDPVDADGVTAIVHDGFDLLHFAGHGRWTDAVPPAQQLLLAAYRPESEPLGTSYSDRDLRRDLPEHEVTDASTGPFVFLNACDLGRRLPTGPASLGGFAEAFLRGGAAAFVGCSWTVGDDPASRFVRAFYECLLDGTSTVAEAARAARLAAHDAADLSDLAYAVYANPHARVIVCDS